MDDEEKKLREAIDDLFLLTEQLLDESRADPRAHERAAKMLRRLEVLRGAKWT